MSETISRFKKGKNSNRNKLGCERNLETNMQNESRMCRKGVEMD